tara:strand:- start:877 stop:1155 length:279 start_codon:yes stop_codon:yes gene_type:complete
MAFLIKNFSPVGGNAKRGDVSSLFTYRTADAEAVVVASGYFNSINSILSVGDQINIIVVDAPDAPTTQSDYINGYVLTNASGVVDIAAMTIV